MLSLPLTEEAENAQQRLHEKEENRGERDLRATAQQNQHTQLMATLSKAFPSQPQMPASDSLQDRFNRYTERTLDELLEAADATVHLHDMQTAQFNPARMFKALQKHSAAELERRLTDIGIPKGDAASIVDEFY